MRSPVSIKKDFDQKILKKNFPFSEGGASKNECTPITPVFFIAESSSALKMGGTLTQDWRDRQCKL